MRTEEEVREWLADLDTYVPMSPEQMVGLAASRDTLKWVLNAQEPSNSPKGDVSTND